jgi:hypothetical protein
MKGSAARCPVSVRRGLVAVSVSAAFVWALALSVSPQLHERVHPDAGQSHHECAITLITAGSYDHTVAAPLVDRPVAPIQFSELPTLNFTWVASLFLSASIFEHAPPALV